MDKLFAFIILLAIAGGVSWWGCARCVKADDVTGADISKMRCSPVLSNGNRNPHYINSWYACNSKCADQKKSPNLSLEDCVCTCQ